MPVAEYMVDLAEVAYEILATRPVFGETDEESDDDDGTEGPRESIGIDETADEC